MAPIHRHRRIHELRHTEALEEFPPQVVIHRHVQRRVDTAHCLPGRAPDQRGRLRDDVELRHQPLTEWMDFEVTPTLAGCLDMIPDPAIGHRRIGVPFERALQQTQTAWQQPIVAVQPADKRSAATADPLVDRGCLASIRVAAPTQQPVFPAADHGQRIIGGAAIGDEHFNR